MGIDLAMDAGRDGGTCMHARQGVIGPRVKSTPRALFTSLAGVDPPSVQARQALVCKPKRRAHDEIPRRIDGRWYIDPWCVHRRRNRFLGYERAPSGGLRYQKDHQESARPHSHSIVAGGLLEISYTTRLTPRTSLMMREDTFARNSYGRRAQSAVIPSFEVTARSDSTFS